MEILIMQPDNKEQMIALKAIAKALKINFRPVELTEREKTINLYGKEFVEKIERGDKAIAEGKGQKVAINDLWK